MGGVILEHIRLEKGNFIFKPNKSTKDARTHARMELCSNSEGNNIMAELNLTSSRANHPTEWFFSLHLIEYIGIPIA
jgi:hypothetical protein